MYESSSLSWPGLTRVYCKHMSLVLILLIVGLISEICVYVGWRWRRAIAAGTAVLVAGSTAALLTLVTNPFSVLFSVIAILRLVNLMRIAGNRIHEDRLRAITVRTSGYALLLSSMTLAAIVNGLPLSWRATLFALAVVQIVGAIVMLWSVRRAFVRSLPPEVHMYMSDKELPTVTVAVPARNETQDMADCLSSILASNYPKLEILVLDDCSHDQTPAIIKQFAHDGVRFIQGEEPNDHWLPKNAAYRRLAQKANGTYIVFCGVDVRIAPQTIRRSIEAMTQQQKTMISILPWRAESSVSHSLIQPMRYWWELALPRRLANRPPVLSTFWIIKRHELASLGGFESVSHSILPERHFAKKLLARDGYAFWRSTTELCVETAKSLPEQRDTAIRTRYPQVHQRLELAYVLLCLELIMFFGPVGGLVYGILGGPMAIVVLSLLSIAIFVIVHWLILRMSDVYNARYALLSFLPAAAVEITLGSLSALKYEFGTVDWKGRNVCLPVMRVYKSLPRV